MQPAIRSNIANLAPETVVQIRRIEADGGTVINRAWMNQTIKMLKSLGIYSSCEFLADANFAVKKDGGNAVSVLYDISGNNNDAVQATGSDQPIWTDDQQNGKAALIYDGTDDVLSAGDIDSFDSAAAITWVAGLKPSALTDFDGIFEKLLNENYRTTLLMRSNGKIYSHINNNAAAYGETTDAGILAVGTRTNITLLFDGGLSGNENRLKIYSNLDAKALSFTGTIPATTGDTGASAVLIGNDIKSGGRFYHGNIDISMMFSSALTTTQRQALETLINNYYAIY